MTVPVTDLDLLDLAAKAYGIGPVIGRDDWFGLAIGPLARLRYWNPLINDGDALRLAAQCEISFGIARNAKLLQVVWWVNGQLQSIDEPEPSKLQSIDTLAWLRRAIVRAAAEIGMAMS